MILDKLENAGRYFTVHPKFEEAFRFLGRADIKSLDVETYTIDGKDVYALIQSKKGKAKEEAQLEAHKEYIDIQFLIEGDEQIGWKPYNECGQISQTYDEAKEIEFFADPPQTYLTLKTGLFAIFFPEDAHAPMISIGNVHKCVVKVRA